MRKYLILTALLFITVKMVVAQEREFTLTGKLFDSTKDGWTVVLEEISDSRKSGLGEPLSATIKNSSFVIKGKLMSDRNLRGIKIQDPDESSELKDLIILTPGSQMLEVDSTFKILDSQINDEFQLFKNQQAEIYTKISILTEKANELMLTKSEQGLDNEVEQLKNEFDQLQLQFVENIYQYTKQNVRNDVGENYFLASLSIFNPTEIKELYSLLRPEFQQDENVQMLMEQLIWSKAGLLQGDEFKNVELFTDQGKKVQVKEYIGKGKIILVDFWASWCAPCRKEMPQLVELYEQYKDKGFEILGISLDERESSWKSSIKSMKMAWPQLSDLKGWKSIACKEYNISQIPQTFLLDREGKILIHNPNKIQLKKKLKELLGE